MRSLRLLSCKTICRPIRNLQLLFFNSYKMILPIVAYGHPVLRKVCKDITSDHPHLEKLIADMWDTLYNSSGVGLAAPQVNKDIRLFVVDTAQMFATMDEEEKKKYPDNPGIK